jgi:hypothetical protein
MAQKRGERRYPRHSAPTGNMIMSPSDRGISEPLFKSNHVLDKLLRGITVANDIRKSERYLKYKLIVTTLALLSTVTRAKTCRFCDIF